MTTFFYCICGVSFVERILSCRSWSQSRDDLGFENLLDRKLLILLPHISITTLSQPYLTDPPVHLTLSTRAFITKCYWRFYLNRPFLFDYFPLICLPSPTHPAGFFFCNFTGFLVIFNVVTSQQPGDSRIEPGDTFSPKTCLWIHIEIHIWWNQP